MKRTALLIFGIVLAFLAEAQVEFGERYEQEHDWQQDSHLVIPNEEEGVLLVQTDYEASSKTYPIFVKHLNLQLEKIWEDTVRIPQRFFVKGYFYSQKRSYILLQNNTQHSIKILRIDTKAKEFKEYDSKEIAELQITEFEVVKNTAIIGGYFEERPVVFAYDMVNNKVRTLQNVYQNQSMLLEVKVNKDSLSFNVLASIQDEQRNKALMVNTYDYEGNPLRDYRIKPEADYELLTSVSSSINDISQVVVGLYGYRSSHAVSGIFVNHIDRTGQQTMNYYNFGELPRFLDYMGEKRATKLKNKTKSMKSAGKEMRYKASAVMRELVEKDGKLIFQGEFYKIFSQDNNFDRLTRNDRLDSYNSFNSLYSSFDQWQNNRPVQESDVTHAYTLVLDQEGNIEWDDFMEIDEDVTGGVDEFGSFTWLGDRASYAFYQEKELFLKMLGKEGNSETLTTALKLKEEGDILRLEKDESLGTVRWFGNQFLVYGVQHIRAEDRTLPLRKVFFINKLTVTNTPVASKRD